MDCMQRKTIYDYTATALWREHMTVTEIRGSTETKLLSSELTVVSSHY